MSKYRVFEVNTPEGKREWGVYLRGRISPGDGITQYRLVQTCSTEQEASALAAELELRVV